MPQGLQNPCTLNSRQTSQAQAGALVLPNLPNPEKVLQPWSSVVLRMPCLFPILILQQAGPAVHQSVPHLLMPGAPGIQNKRLRNGRYSEPFTCNVASLCFNAHPGPDSPNCLLAFNTSIVTYYIRQLVFVTAALPVVIYQLKCDYHSTQLYSFY